MNNQLGGCLDQHTILINLESCLGTTAVATADILGTSYNTYKCWKSGTRVMTGPTILAINLLTDVANTPIGIKYGI